MRFKNRTAFGQDMDAEHYGHILGRYADSLVRNLHGHHTWEDRQFFPELARADPRFETGLDLLEQDHEVLDETLDRFTRASNRYLKRWIWIQHPLTKNWEIFTQLDVRSNRCCRVICKMRKI